MSVDFSVPLGLPFPRAIIDPVLPDVRWLGAEPADPVTGLGRWRLYREGVSTRVVSVGYDAGTLDVRVPIASSVEDCDLALDIVRRAAAYTGAEIDSDHGPLSVGQLDEIYDAAWKSDQLDGAVTAVARLVEDHDGGVVSLPGPIRDVCVGRGVLAELAAGLPLTELMRRVQWTDPRYGPAGTLTASRDGTEFTLAVLIPGRACVLPWTDRVALVDPAGGHLLIPRNTLEQLPIRHTRLDDGNHLIEAIEASEWPRVVDTARTLAIQD